MEIKEKLELHAKWLRGEIDGVRINLRAADLRRADLRAAVLSGADLRRAGLRRAGLRRADLRDAVLSGADLSAAVLSGAVLRAADLSYAVLRDADLRRADLRRADLSGADLRRAGLRRADLRRADLRDADLRDADLRRADLRDAVLSGAENIPDTARILTQIVPDEGMYTAFKKAHRVGTDRIGTGTYEQVIIKLLIPEDAKRSNATGRKCRASKAMVIDIESLSGEKLSEAVSRHDASFIYRTGAVVECDNWSDNRWEECAGGIHHYITRLEAELH